MTENQYDAGDRAPRLRAADLFHTGIVVPDLDAHAKLMTEAAGYRWMEPQTVEIPIRMAGGDRVLRMRYAYSIDEPTVELAEAIPGTPWAVPPGGGLHHLGYYCDDLAATAAELVERGYELEAHPVVDGEMAVFACLLDPAGVRVEILDRGRVPGLATIKRGQPGVGA